MKRNKIAAISAVIIGTSIIGLTLGGCSELKRLDTTLLISNDVKAEELSKSIKVASKTEYSLEDPGNGNDHQLFLDEDNELYTITYDDGYTFEKLIFEDKKVLKEDVYENLKCDFTNEGIMVYEISLGKVGLYNPQTNEKSILDIDKFKNSECYKAMDFDNKNYQYISGNIITYINDESDSISNKKIISYDITENICKRIDIPNTINLKSVAKIEEDTLYYTSSEDSELASKVGTINLVDNTLTEPIEVGTMYKINVLDENRILVYGAGEVGKSLKLVNIKNKVSKEITNLRVHPGNVIVPKSKDRIIYEEIVDGKNQVVAAYLKNEEIEGKCVIYEGDVGEILTIAVSDDGQTIVIGTMEDVRNSYSYFNTITEIKLEK